jgi:hypothetical protein
LIPHEATKYTKTNQTKILRIPRDLRVLCASVVEKCGLSAWTGITHVPPVEHPAGSPHHPANRSCRTRSAHRCAPPSQAKNPTATLSKENNP